MLAGIVALWALIFLWVVTELRSEDPPAKAVGTDLFTGPANIPLAAIAGEASGTVTAATTGHGIARITVEAWRVKADGTLLPVASAATDDEGAYVLPTLIPGEYRLRYSADGFVERWYTAPGDAAADPAVGSPVRIEAQGSAGGLDVALGGVTGSLTGQIALPPGSAGTPLTVTATLLTETSGTGGSGGADGTGGPEPQTFTQTTTDGSIALDGLPTPGTFQVTVTGLGFDTQSFQATVGGGQAGVLNTVTMGAASGTITGTVVDGAGTPLGGVAVVARAGDTEVRATTPTSGPVGSFDLVGLATPETYVLTFSLDGYSGQTVALSLPAGGSQSVQAQLIGGSGTVTGSVVGTDGAPLGGVTVSVAGDGFTGQTTTLTTNGPAGAAGSYTVTGLPVPGVYTITFEAPGFLSETLGAGFLAAGTQPLDTVTLLPERGSVRGVARTAGGGGLGEVTVTLTDGTITRTTTSATAPAGQYSFVDVPAGWYAVTFTRPGYVTRVVQIEVVAGTAAARDVELAVRG